MRIRRVSGAILALVISLPSQGAFADTAPKPGSPCKQGQNYSSGGVQYKCIKSGSKYVWDKGTKGSSGKNNSGTINVGDPCDRDGQEGPLKGGTAICSKVNGSLKWQAKTDSQNNNQGNKDNNQNKNSGTTSMGMNADGTWQTLPGYPTDVAPPGNNGAEWFQGNWDLYTAQPTSPKCTTTTPITESPAALSDIQSIVPQGYMQTGAHNLPVAHMYWNTELSSDVDSNGLKYVSKRVKVYAPADMTLRTLSTSTLSKDGKSYSEYGLSFSLCGNYWTTWAHLDNISQDLLSAAKTAAKHECATGGQNNQSQDCYDSYISYRIKAGTFIGTSSGRSGGFDLGFYDTSKLNKNILNPHAFKGRITTGKCVMFYAVEPLRSNLMAKLIGDTNCGGVGYDIKGTASGVWLNPDHMAESVIEDLHIALVPHWSDSKLSVFSIGDKISIPGLNPGGYTFTQNSSGPINKPFASVKAGDVACYDHLSGWLNGSVLSIGSILIQTKAGDPESISIAGSPNDCGSGPFKMPEKVAKFQRKTSA